MLYSPINIIYNDRKPVNEFFVQKRQKYMYKTPVSGIVYLGLE